MVKDEKLIVKDEIDFIELTLEEHIELLKQLGYEIDSTVEEIPQYSEVEIIYKGKAVGFLSFQDRNMYYLYRDNKIVGNRDLSKINFIKNKSMRSMVYTRINHRDFHVFCYNQLVSDDRPFICLTDNKKYRIIKYLDQEKIQVESLIDDVVNNEIIDYLRKPKEKTLTYKIKGV